MTLQVKIRRLRPDVQLPAYATSGSAGMDLRAAEPARLAPGDIVAVPTGLAVEIPEGYEAQIRPRSGLALKRGLSIPNAPGTIDSDYRGEIAVILINLGRAPIEIQRGDRIAQMIVAPVASVQWVESHDLTDTKRGSGGFGHTCIH